MHNNNITHYKQGREARTVRSNWRSWRESEHFMFNVSSSQTHTVCVQAFQSLSAICRVYDKRRSRSLELTWPQLDTPVGRRRAPDTRGTEGGWDGRTDGAQPSGLQTVCRHNCPSLNNLSLWGWISRNPSGTCGTFYTKMKIFFLFSIRFS